MASSPWHMCALFLVLALSTVFSRRAGDVVVIDGVSYTVLDTYQPGTEEEFPPSLAGVLYTMDYIGTPQDFTYTLISQFKETRNWEVYPVWVNSTGFASPVEAQNSSLGRSQFVSFRTLALASRPCGEAMIKFLGAGLFPLSNVIDHDFVASGDFLVSTLFYPSFPSFSVCQDVFTKCNDLIPVDSLLQIVGGDCFQTISRSQLNGAIVFPDQPRFPKDSSYILLNFTNKYIVYLPATNYPVNPIYTPPCKYPLTLNKKAFASDPHARACQDKCQSLLSYTQDDWDIFFAVEAACSWLSWLTAFYMVITLSMIPKNRRYPGFMTVFVYISFIIMNTVWVTISWYGEHGYFMCPDEYTYPTFDNSGVCLYSAIFLVYGGLMLILFWTMMSVNTYLSISLRMSLDPKIWGPITLLVGLGIPAIAIIIGGNIDIHYLPILLFCFNFTTWYLWLFWQVPILLGIIVNMFCCSFVLYEIRNISDSSKGKRGKIYKVIRIVGFLLCFFEVAAFVFSFNIYAVTVNEDHYHHVGEAYARCLYLNEPECPRPASGEGAPSVASMVVFIVQIVLIGAITFLILGTTNQVLWFWCRRIKGEEEESSTGGSSTMSKASWAAAGGGGGGGDGGEDSYDPDQ